MPTAYPKRPRSGSRASGWLESRMGKLSTNIIIGLLWNYMYNSWYYSSYVLIRHKLFLFVYIVTEHDNTVFIIWLKVLCLLLLPPAWIKGNNTVYTWLWSCTAYVPASTECNFVFLMELRFVLMGKNTVLRAYLLQMFWNFELTLFWCIEFIE